MGQRFREDLGTPDELQELADSIRNYGLIHPPAVDENWNLVAGGRRFHVCTNILGWEEVPITLAETKNEEVILRIMECEENLRRKELNWKEKINIIAEVHRLSKQKAALNSEKWTLQATGELLGLSLGNVQYCVELTKLLKDVKHPIQKAESLTEAFKILLQMKEDEAIRVDSQFAKDIEKSGGFQTKGATLSIDSLIQAAAPQVVKKEDGTTVEVQREAQPVPTGVAKQQLLVDVSKYFVKGDAMKLMDDTPIETIDHIITDIPYGIDMDNLDQDSTGMIDIDRVADEHDVERNIQLFHDFFPRAYKVLKPDAFCVVWMDLDHWELFKTLATKSGFKVCRWPLHWVKTHRCKNQSAQYNPTKAVEHAIMLRKGNATLATPMGCNYWTGDNEQAKKDFGHPFAKPEGLWRWIASSVAQKGAIILDPFAGSFSGPIAFAKGGYFPRGFELKDIHFNKGIMKFKELMTNWFHDREVIFT